jgi:nitrite reductase/ring-hydroxylating ferredoxin subunit
MSEFVPVIAFDSLKPGGITPVRAGHRYLAIYLIDGQPFCTEDICTHEESLISNGGFLEGFEAECPLHGARYDVRTGEVTMLPASEPLRTFAAEVRDGMVCVRLG